MTRNTDAGPYGYRVRNEYDSNHLTRNDWRASLVPAAAVIPAPTAYVKVAAVKKLVVECRVPRDRAAPRGRPGSGTPPPRASPPRGGRGGRVYLEKIGAIQAGGTSPRTIGHGITEEGVDPTSLVPWAEARTIDRDGRGRSYRAARGEILGSARDGLPRKRSARTLPLIENESRGIEDDQIPS